MGDDIIEYKNLYNKIFLTIIKKIYPKLYDTTINEIRSGISQIDLASRTGDNEFKRIYASVYPQTILEALQEYEYEKQLTDAELRGVIHRLNTSIQNGPFFENTVTVVDERDKIDERAEERRATWTAANKERPIIYRPLNRPLNRPPRGGSRRKRKRTRKLRKHYKSRKSSNKYIRRKK